MLRPFIRSLIHSIFYMLNSNYGINCKTRRSTHVVHLYMPSIFTYGPCTYLKFQNKITLFHYKWIQKKLYCCNRSQKPSAYMGVSVPWSSSHSFTPKFFLSVNFFSTLFRFIRLNFATVYNNNKVSAYRAIYYAVSIVDSPIFFISLEDWITETSNQKLFSIFKFQIRIRWTLGLIRSY